MFSKRSILMKSIHEREFHVPHVSMVFSFAGGGPWLRFFRNISSPSLFLFFLSFLYLLASYLIRGSLIRTRGREWTAKDHSVLLHVYKRGDLVSFFPRRLPRERQKHALLNAIIAWPFGS